MSVEGWIIWGMCACVLLSCLIATILNWDRQPKRIWKCIRHQGGGTLTTPYQMTQVRAMEWISKNHGEIIYVDDINGFIFYRPTNR